MTSTHSILVLHSPLTLILSQGLRITIGNHRASLFCDVFVLTAASTTGQDSMVLVSLISAMSKLSSPSPSLLPKVVSLAKTRPPASFFLQRSSPPPWILIWTSTSSVSHPRCTRVCPSTCMLHKCVAFSVFHNQGWRGAYSRIEGGEWEMGSVFWILFSIAKAREGFTWPKTSSWGEGAQVSFRG